MPPITESICNNLILFAVFPVIAFSSINNLEASNKDVEGKVSLDLLIIFST